MNPVGIYYAYWTHGWDADFEPYVMKVSGLGFDVLEVNAGTIANMLNSQRRQLRDTARGEGIELTACIGLPKEFDIASTDAFTRGHGIDYLRKQIEGLAETGIQKLGGIVYSYWPGSMPAGETDRQPYWDRSVASMKDVMRAAEDAGVVLHMEVVNRFEQFLINTAVEAVEYVKEVDSPNCSILLDTFHMNIEEDSFRDAIVTAGKHLGHMHIGETNRRAPGRGKMAWESIFSELHEIGYEGAVVMEPFLMPGGEVGRDIKVFRDLRDGLGLDDEAGRACQFVKQRLAEVGR